MDICAICEYNKNRYLDIFTYTEIPYYYYINENTSRKYNNDKIVMKINEYLKYNKSLKICGDCHEVHNERIFKLRKSD